MLKLNIGCGEVYFNGWINIDIDSAKADLKHDLRGALPYDDCSVDFIYSEHFIEHLTVSEGVALLSECRRILKTNGIVRTATLDLDYIVLKYIFSWKNQSWIHEYGYDYLKTKAEMLNLCFREWGHQYLYNREELARRLREAGFVRISRHRIGKSKYAELLGRETRKDSKLILEAKK